MIFDGIRSAESLFREHYSGPLQGIVEAQFLFYNYKEEENTVIMMTYVLNERGVIENKYEQEIPLEPSLISEILSSEFRYCENNRISIKVKVEDNSQFNGFKALWFFIGGDSHVGSISMSSEHIVREIKLNKIK